MIFNRKLVTKSKSAGNAFPADLFGLISRKYIKHRQLSSSSTPAPIELRPPPYDKSTSNRYALRVSFISYGVLALFLFSALVSFPDGKMIVWIETPFYVSVVLIHTEMKMRREFSASSRRTVSRAPYCSNNHARLDHLTDF